MTLKNFVFPTALWNSLLASDGLPIIFSAFIAIIQTIVFDWTLIDALGFFIGQGVVLCGFMSLFGRESRHGLFRLLLVAGLGGVFLFLVANSTLPETLLDQNVTNRGLPWFALVSGAVFASVDSIIFRIRTSDNAVLVARVDARSTPILIMLGAFILFPPLMAIFFVGLMIGPYGAIPLILAKGGWELILAYHGRKTPV